MIRRALPGVLVLGLAACATPTPPTAPPAEPAAPAPAPAPVVEPAAPVPLVTADLAAGRAAFARETSQRFGIPEAAILATLERASIREGIVNAMSRPAEAKPWRDYRPLFIQQPRIDAGRAFLNQHRAELDAAHARYGVPPEIVAAIIGVETSYGRNMGSWPVVDALYTLAFRYPRTNAPERIARENQREAFFRDELAQVFAMGREQGMDVGALKGSYAGAMGLGQFMPSSYRQYAVDGDGDGRADLFASRADAIHSVANYFVGRGQWQRGGPVMRRATRAPAARDFHNPGSAVQLTETVGSLAALGYAINDPAIPASTPASLITLEGANGPEYWVVFNNFSAIAKYNISRLYATAVYQLAEAIAGRSPEPR